MKTNAHSNLIELNIVPKAGGLQNNRKGHSVEAQEGKVHAYIALACQVCALMAAGIFMAEGISLAGVYALSTGVITGIGHTLCVLAKIHPTKLLMGFLCAVGLAGLLSSLGIFLLF